MWYFVEKGNKPTFVLWERELKIKSLVLLIIKLLISFKTQKKRVDKFGGKILLKYTNKKER